MQQAGGPWVVNDLKLQGTYLIQKSNFSELDHGSQGQPPARARPPLSTQCWKIEREGETQFQRFSDQNDFSQCPCLKVSDEISMSFIISASLLDTLLIKTPQSYKDKRALNKIGQNKIIFPDLRPPIPLRHLTRTDMCGVDFVTRVTGSQLNTPGPWHNAGHMMQYVTQVTWHHKDQMYTRCLWSAFSCLKVTQTGHTIHLIAEKICWNNDG